MRFTESPQRCNQCYQIKPPDAFIWNIKTSVLGKTCIPCVHLKKMLVKAKKKRNAN